MVYAAAQRTAAVPAAALTESFEKFLRTNPSDRSRFDGMRFLPQTRGSPDATKDTIE